MTCDDVRKLLTLLTHDELSGDEEDRVMAHLGACAECRMALDREQKIHRVLDLQEPELPPNLLQRSRASLHEALALERSRANWIERLRTWLPAPALARPAGVLALIALGFLAGRLAPNATLSGMQSAGFFDPNTARVRYVEPGQGGQVQIIVDETRQRVLSGHLDDARIRGLLLAAVKDPLDPGLRVESVELLKGKSEDDEVRAALISALQHDTNAGVRLRALEGLKPFAGNADVRKALTLALLSDANPSIRTQAIDILTQDSRSPQVVGALQGLMNVEQDESVRRRCEKALRAMKASVETY